MAPSVVGACHPGHGYCFDLPQTDEVRGDVGIQFMLQYFYNVKHLSQKSFLSRSLLSLADDAAAWTNVGFDSRETALLV